MMEILRDYRGRWVQFNLRHEHQNFELMKLIARRNVFVGKRIFVDTNIEFGDSWVAKGAAPQSPAYLMHCIAVRRLRTV
ncbi:hypothetical protein [Viridibacterium curvum]|uniref:hypothetical protein n=1 Tax=Viridibacterium curvum TaxID=1101404 RepID=UPI0031EA0561